MINWKQKRIKLNLMSIPVTRHLELSFLRGEIRIKIRIKIRIRMDKRIKKKKKMHIKKHLTVK